MQSLCPNKEVCGSCSWSHIPYEKQLQQKVNEINFSFKLHKLDLQLKEILPSPKTSHYRNRMDFVIDFEGRVGLRQKGKWWRVIDNHTCFISDEKIEELFHIVRDWAQNAGLTFFDRKYHHGLLRYAVIRTTTTGESMITIVTSQPKDDSENEQLTKALSNLSKLVTRNSILATLIHSINKTTSDVSHGGEVHIILGKGYIIEEINGYKYKITPNAFFQTNSHAAKLLMDTVLEFAETAIRLPRFARNDKSTNPSDTATSSRGENQRNDLPETLQLSNSPSPQHSNTTTLQPTTPITILDLYSGSGFFTIPLADKFNANTIGVEIVKDAIEDAKENNKLNNTNATFIAMPSEDYDWSELNPNLVILDPPRSGLRKTALSQLVTLQPDNLIYVSCNFKNFSRDMQTLQKIYEVKKMRGIDMFPHTPHVELVTLLTKKNREIPRIC